VQGGYGQYVLPTAGMSSGPPDGASGRRDLARIGTLVSDQARCRMLLALGDGRALSASVLAAEAGVTAATASSHLHSSPPAACWWLRPWADAGTTGWPVLRSAPSSRRWNG
jgi:hypothetical protein